MCGIVGAIASKNVIPELMATLDRLGYRGYDSAGVAYMSAAMTIERHRTAGTVRDLNHLLSLQDPSTTISPLAIAHTRWATHGQAITKNAHPHTSSNGRVAIVHNGIIENHQTLRQQLVAQGYTFTSDTDSEVIAHLIDLHSRSTDFLSAIRSATKQLDGAFALAIIHQDHPDKLYAVRHKCPLVIGINEHAHFIASDLHALQPVIKQAVHLEDQDIAMIEPGAFCIFNQQQQPIERPIILNHSRADTHEKGDHPHFMHKEMHEQADVLQKTMQAFLAHPSPKTNFFGAKASAIFDHVDHIVLCACGTSYHAAAVGRYWLESITKISTQVEIASEFRYRNPVVRPRSLFIVLSQSGETADTLSALELAKSSGFMATMAICNVACSTLAGATDLLFVTQAGTEIGVAATKTFTTALAGLLCLLTALSEQRAPQHTQGLIDAMTTLPKPTMAAIQLEPDIASLAREIADKNSVLFLGRQALYPIAQEGALKLKEISYIHAEAYPAGELKHGPLALIDPQLPSIVLAASDARLHKLISNIEEIQARNGPVIVFCDADAAEHLPTGTRHFILPRTADVLAPIIFTIPLQLLSYYVAKERGTNCDQPRNLAKSVTVE